MSVANKYKYKKNVFFVLLFVSSAIFFLFSEMNVKNPFLKKGNVHSFYPKNTNQILLALSEDEQYFLDFFLRDFLLDNEAAYVLFGSKPAAIDTYCLHDDDSFPNISSPALSSRNSKAKKGCYILRKHKELLNKKDVVLLFSDQPSSVDITLINKRNFINVVNEHIEDFKKELGAEITPESLLNKIIENQRLDEVLNHHDGLIGIILGYGRNNAFLFHAEKSILQKKGKYAILQLNDSIEKTLFSLMQRLKPFSDEPTPLALLPLPAFVADPHEPETRILKTRYIAQRKYIHEVYRESNFLEMTLSQL